MDGSYLLSLTGNPRCGKDTVAKLLIERQGFKKFSFAEALYKEVAAAFNVSVADLESDYWKSTPQNDLALYHCTDVNFYNIAIKLDEGNAMPAQAPRTSRQILQWWGTEYRRAQDDRYWIRRLDESVSAYWGDELHPRVVITDCRFDNEAKWHDAASDLFAADSIVRITRPGADPTKHTSDVPVSNNFIDATIANNETHECLYGKVLAIIMADLHNSEPKA